MYRSIAPEKRHLFDSQQQQTFPLLVKMEAKDENSKKPLELFLMIGLHEITARNTIANSKVTANLIAVIHEAAVTNGCHRTVGNFLYTVASKYPVSALVHRPTLLKYIVCSKIKTPTQLQAAFSFFSSIGSEDFKLNEFEESCGVGVEVSTEDIKQTVDEIFEKNKAVILERRYRTNVGELLRAVRKKLPWADGKISKQLVDAKMFELLGERTAADKVHTEVFFRNGSVLRCYNMREILDKHLTVTGGKIFTRFPSEPNGYLHIGHAKAMFVESLRINGCMMPLAFALHRSWFVNTTWKRPTFESDKA